MNSKDDIIRVVDGAKIWGNESSFRYTKIIRKIEKDDFEGAIRGIDNLLIWEDDFGAKLRLNDARSKLKNM